MVKLLKLFKLHTISFPKNLSLFKRMTRFFKNSLGFPDFKLSLLLEKLNFSLKKLLNSGLFEKKIILVGELLSF